MTAHSKHVLTFIGTRPEIIKMSALIPELDKEFHHTLVHSGQHYSPEMDRLFFEELELRQPDYNLNVQSSSGAGQLARMMEHLDEIVQRVRPDLIIVQGDTNTTLAGALVAAAHKRSGLLLGHVEAGARSHLPMQPEEMNRKVVDQLSDLLLASYVQERTNLLNEGIAAERIHVVGSTVVASCRRMNTLLNGNDEISGFHLHADTYAFATFHRQETVDSFHTLSSVWTALNRLAERLPVFVPLHPRTRKRMAEFGITVQTPELRISEPVGYRASISLLRNARLCLTDSGGLQEESGILGVPALVLRDGTEHTRYVESGMHELVGTDADRIQERALALLDDPVLYDSRKQAVLDHPADTPVRVITGIRSLLCP